MSLSPLKIQQRLDHLVRIRQGSLNPATAIPTAPYIFGKDLAVGLMRTVPDTFALVADSRQSARKKEDVCFEPPAEGDVYRLKSDPSACANNDGFNEIDLQWGRDRRTSWQIFLVHARQIPWLIFKPFSTGLVIDGLGHESWSIMKRRTELMFHHEDDVAVPAKRADSRTLTAFLEKLKETVKTSDHPDIDFVGHSAGTLVLNRALREVPDLPIANIVYMAAATSLEDYENAVLGDGTSTGFMAHHPGTQVFHLVLHPLAEVEENDLGITEIQPRGSLLYWIDNFLDDPEYYRQRTLGSAKNLLARIEATPQPLRSRVHVKIFDYGIAVHAEKKDWYTWCSENHSACQPQRHSDFGAMPFWEPWFWTPNSGNEH